MAAKQELRDQRKITSLTESEANRMYARIDQIKSETGNRRFSESDFIRQAVLEKLKRELKK